VSYAEFLASKAIAAPPCGIPDPPELSPLLFEFQRDITRWALRRGRAAIWADCGLGKSWMALEWARVVSETQGGPVLILTPLAVAQQFVEEGRKLGIPVRHIGDRAEHGDGIEVCNYDRIHRLDLGRYVGVVLDESSILKDYAGATRNAIIEGFARTPFRLACTATPAPNDYLELGNHAEFLGVMMRKDMLSTFFINDIEGAADTKWRLKGHAQGDFWRWLTSWAVALRSPSDLGYDATGYDLPALKMRHVVTVTDHSEAAKELGTLFVLDAKTLSEQRAARRASLKDRILEAQILVAKEPDESWILWCDLNAESSALAAAIPGAVEVTGSDPPEVKEARMAAFRSGEIKVLVSKPSIAGWGVNWQHCARVIFVGVTHSFEAWYQAIRRTWRFGQRREVHCYVISSDIEGNVLASLARKQADAEKMVAGMVAQMVDLSSVEIRGANRVRTEYDGAGAIKIPAWLQTEREAS
jgi:superfamily II DNA or RNA helicase